MKLVDYEPHTPSHYSFICPSDVFHFLDLYQRVGKREKGKGVMRERV